MSSRLGFPPGKPPLPEKLDRPATGGYPPRCPTPGTTARQNAARGRGPAFEPGYVLLGRVTFEVAVNSCRTGGTIPRSRFKARDLPSGTQSGQGALMHAV